MSTRDAVLPARRSTQARTAGARRTKRSDFLRAYSPISFSQAFRVILLVAKRLEPNGGRVKLAGLNATLMDVFEISGFSKLFIIVPSVQDAL